MNVEKSAATSQSADLAGKYLTFVLADEEYGVPVLKVREIIKMMDITEVPQVPAHVRGVLNLRGKVIPVVDLRLKFGFAKGDVNARTCIIVVDVGLASGPVLMGVIVDQVSDVLNIVAEEIEEMPEFGERVCTDCMKGVAKVKGTVKVLLDLDRVLTTDGAIGRAA
jgi:purine-binding chemotaxis protein CheW